MCRHPGRFCGQGNASEVKGLVIGVAPSIYPGGIGMPRIVVCTECCGESFFCRTKACSLACDSKDGAVQSVEINVAKINSCSYAVPSDCHITVIIEVDTGVKVETVNKPFGGCICGEFLIIVGIIYVIGNATNCGLKILPIIIIIQPYPFILISCLDVSVFVNFITKV